MEARSASSEPFLYYSFCRPHRQAESVVNGLEREALPPPVPPSTTDGNDVTEASSVPLENMTPGEPEEKSQKMAAHMTQRAAVSGFRQLPAAYNWTDALSNRLKCLFHLL